MKVIAIVILLVIITGGITFFTSNPDYFVRRGSDQTAAPLRIPGVVEANEVTVSARTGGRIQELKVGEGALVEANSLIATLDREELEAQRREQQARILQLTAKLNQTKELAAFQQESTQEMVARAAAQLQVAESQRKQALTDLDQLRKDLERDKALVETDSLTRRDYERQLSAVQSGETRVHSLEDQVLSATADLKLSRANQRQVAVAGQEVEQTQALLQQAQAQLAQTITRLGYTQVWAPLSGMVSLRVASQGEMVKAGDPILTIVDLNDIWVRAGVEESFITGELVGQPLTVQLASGEELQGKVITVSPEGAFATQRDVSRVKRDVRTFDIKVRLPNPNRTVHPGMTAYVLLPKTAATGDGRDAGKRALLPKTQ